MLDALRCAARRVEVWFSIAKWDLPLKIYRALRDDFVSCCFWVEGVRGWSSKVQEALAGQTNLCVL